MKSFAIWGLFDPDKKIVHVQHSTVQPVIRTLDLPVHRVSSEAAMNRGASEWYKFQYDNGHVFPKRMDDWFCDMNARETHPLVKVLATGDADATNVQERKVQAMENLYKDGFDVVTRYLGPGQGG